MLTAKRIREIEERQRVSAMCYNGGSYKAAEIGMSVCYDIPALLEHIAAQEMQLEHFRKMRYHA